MTPPAPATSRPQSAPAAAPERGFPASGERLVLLLGAFRSGTTLLRKVLDGHPRIHAPAETWFLRPLLELWHGRGTGEGFVPAQAAAALRQHLDRPAFLECCRAFAAQFYASAGAPSDGLFVDKTPLYLPVADELAELFPSARFLLLTRDPRGILWSRITWRHATERDPRRAIKGVAADIQRLAAVQRTHAARTIPVAYEALCLDPAAEATRVSDALGLPPAPDMVDYGQHAHHEGYGDENTRAHQRPHTASIAAWAAADALSLEVQAELLAACGADALETLGLGDLQPESADAGRTPPRPARPTGGGGDDGPRLLLLTHGGTNSRDHLLDFARGFASAGATVLNVELPELCTGDTAGQAAEPQLIANRLQNVVREHRPDGSLAMWANAISGLPPAMVDGTPRPLIGALGVPQLAFWLDAPGWAYQGQFVEQFGNPLLRDPSVTHLINNPGMATEMTEVFGFGRTLPCPYGIDPEVFRPVPGVTPEFDLVFCLGPGAAPPTPMMLEELASDEPDHERIRRDVAVGVRASLLADREALAGADADADAIAALVDAMVEGQLAQRDTPILTRLATLVAARPELAAAAAALRANSAQWVAVTMGLRRIEQWERAFVFTWLARRFQCAVFSRPSLEGWDCPAERLGWVEHREQSAAYARGRVGLNVMRWQDDVGVNPKPLEITASGVACLAQQRTGLDEQLTPGTEVSSFRTAAEAGERLRELLGSDSRRTAQAEAGAARTRRDHTWAARAAALLPAATGHAAAAG